MNYFDCKSQKSPSTGDSAPRPPFWYNDKRMSKIQLPINMSGDADARQFEGKTKLYIFCPSPLVQKKIDGTDGTNDALHSRAQPGRRLRRLKPLP